MGGRDPSPKKWDRAVKIKRLAISKVGKPLGKHDWGGMLRGEKKERAFSSGD